MRGSEQRERPFDTAESKTLGICEDSMRENREAPETSAPDGGAGRSEKAKSCTSDMHVSGESDYLVVPRKRANKVGAQGDRGQSALTAEHVEGRRSTKGNAAQQAVVRTQSRGAALTGLYGVRQAASRDRKARFTALLHHVTPELLQESYFELKRQAAPGVDAMTWEEYREGMEERIADVQGRVQRGTYRAKPSKRAWITKADGGERPLGIAALEDKIVQQALKTILEQIFEVEFLGFSYGFRPGRSQHNALDALWVGLMKRRINWVLDADIRGFFDAPSTTSG
jgi:hypothetical protein